MQLEQQVAEFVRQRSPMAFGDIIDIPVVVHILHTGQPVGTGLNISTAQIHSQINVLNEDFRRLNPDATNTPTVFQGVRADVEFRFVLACVDPNENPTSGIVRVQTTINEFIIEDTNNNNQIDLIEEQNSGIKFAPTGSPAWPADRYLNIWVCNLGEDLLGYAQFPDMMATQPETDGVVIRTTSFGTVGNVSAPFNKGRTATHEVGHWLNLSHIWGDANCGNDFVADTPTQSGPNYNCPSHPHVSCGSNDMFMNYMDYTDDACMNLFTRGQAERMWSLFATGGVRESFVTCNLITQACIAPPTISGPPSVCGSASFSINNLPSDASITWSHGLYLTRVSAQGSNPCMFGNIGAGASWVGAVVSTGCGDITIPAKTVSAGGPPPTQIIGFEYNGKEFGSNSTYQFRVSHLGAIDYEWNVGGGTIIGGQGTDRITVQTVRVTGRGNVYFDVGVRVRTASCGWSGYLVRFGYVTPLSGGVTRVIYPNPGANEATVSLMTPTGESFDVLTAWDLEVYDHNQELTLRKNGLTGPSTTINTMGWKDGIYIVRINYNGEILNDRLVIKN